MLLINLQNCYLRKVTEIGTAWLYAELSVGSLARGAEGGREGALHSFSLHRILFFQGGWLPGNSKYNWRNGFIWRESRERREGAEHRAVTKLRMGWRNPHLFRWLLSKLHTIIYFRILSYPVSIPWKKRKMSVELAAPRALPAALLGWCLAPKKHRYRSHVPIGHQGAPRLRSHLPDSSPSYPALPSSFTSSSFPLA